MPSTRPAGINAFTIGTIVVLGIIAIAVALVDTGDPFPSSSDRN